MKEKVRIQASNYMLLVVGCVLGYFAYSKGENSLFIVSFLLIGIGVLRMFLLRKLINVEKQAEAIMNDENNDDEPLI